MGLLEKAEKSQTDTPDPAPAKIETLPAPEPIANTEPEPEPKKEKKTRRELLHILHVDVAVGGLQRLVIALEGDVVEQRDRGVVLPDHPHRLLGVCKQQRR